MGGAANDPPTLTLSLKQGELKNNGRTPEYALLLPVTVGGKHQTKHYIRNKDDQ